MQKDECFYLGKITKLHGYKGEVVLFLDVDDPSAYSEIDSFFVDTPTGLVPYFVEKALPKTNNSVRLKVEDINSEKEARALINLEVYLPDALLPELKGNKFYYHEIVGFEVEDTEKGLLGKLIRVQDFSSNPLLEIKHFPHPILVPLNDDTLVSLNRDDKKIMVKVPDGLLELYSTEFDKNEPDDADELDASLN